MVWGHQPKECFVWGVGGKKEGGWKCAKATTWKGRFDLRFGDPKTEKKNVNAPLYFLDFWATELLSTFAL
jgi:hypothetical protein